MFNKSEILKEAHAQTKRLRASGTVFAEMPYVKLFTQRMAYVWSQEKTSDEVKALSLQLTVLENKNHLTASDYTRISELRKKLSRVGDEMTIYPDMRGWKDGMTTMYSNLRGWKDTA